MDDQDVDHLGGPSPDQTVQLLTGRPELGHVAQHGDSEPPR